VSSIVVVRRRPVVVIVTAVKCTRARDASRVNLVSARRFNALEASEKVIHLNLGVSIRRFCVGNLRNGWLLRAVSASNRQILIASLGGPDLLRGALASTRGAS
jgi:hypothetical protein